MRPGRVQFTTRMTDSLKARLEVAAKANGRSLSEEIEFRLEINHYERHVRPALMAARGGWK